VIPTSLRASVLDELHIGHMGISKMKALARSYCYWRNIDSDIEQMVKACRSCCTTQNNVRKIQPHPWDFPKRAWERVHVDYAGPFMDHNFLIIVDAYSKWPEIIKTKSTNAAATIEILRDTFSRFGLPPILVSDNGTNFRSAEFETFLKSNGIHHKLSAPYHPATNGQAERFVQIMKQSLRAMATEPGDISLKLSRFLMQYRITPHTTTKRSPAELMFGRNIRSRLDIMRSDLQQEMSLNNYTPPSRSPCFTPGQSVQIRFYNNPSNKWRFGTIVGQRGSLNYDILVDGIEHHRHVSQIRSTGYKGHNEIPFNDQRFIKAPVVPTLSEPSKPVQPSRRSTVHEPPPVQHEQQQQRSRRSVVPPVVTQPASPPPPAPIPQPPMDIIRRSERVRRPPDRLNL
jgi:hypothetical protein